MSLDLWSVLIGVGAAMLALLILLAARTRRMGERLGGQAPAIKSGADPRMEKGEGQASVAAEQIEEMANRELGAYPGVRVDFGTAADGSLEIWVGSDRYGSVDDIADVRVREAVGRAVAKFNR